MDYIPIGVPPAIPAKLTRRDVIFPPSVVVGGPKVSLDSLVWGPGFKVKILKMDARRQP